MSPKLTPKSAIITGGATAVAIGGLAMAMAMGPAAAEDADSALSGLTDSATLADSGNLPAEGDHRMGGEGMGRHGGGHGMGGGRGMGRPAPAVDGTLVLRDETFKADDGTLTVLRHQVGSVTAVSDVELTLKTGSVSKTYALDSDTDGDLASLAVGDTAGVRATVSGGTATAIDVHEMVAPGVDGRGHMGGRGPEDGMGRHGDRGPAGPMADYGTRIAGESIIEQADGQLVTVRDYHGTVVSVDGSVIKVSTVDGQTRTFTVPAGVTPQRGHADAALADFAAGDEVMVEVTLSGGDETVVSVRGHAPFTGERDGESPNPNA